MDTRQRNELQRLSGSVAVVSEYVVRRMFQFGFTGTAVDLMTFFRACIIGAQVLTEGNKAFSEQVRLTFCRESENEAWFLKLQGLGITLSFLEQWGIARERSLSITVSGNRIQDAWAKCRVLEESDLKAAFKQCGITVTSLEAFDIAVRAWRTSLESPRKYLGDSIPLFESCWRRERFAVPLYFALSEEQRASNGWLRKRGLHNDESRLWRIRLIFYGYTLETVDVIRNQGKQQKIKPQLRVVS